MTRRQRRFAVYAVSSLVFAGAIGLIVARAGGTFKTQTFLILFFTIFAVFLLVSFVLSLPAVKGAIGEANVNRALKSLSRKYGGSYIHNVIIPDEQGKTSQIDHVYVGPKGVFVIETKNYSGRIYGSEGQKEWTQVLAYGKVKNKLYNPHMQNRTHIRRLQGVLSKEVPMENVVVFVEGNTDFIDCDGVYTVREFKRYVRQHDASLAQDDATGILKEIQTYKDNPVATSKEHVRQIQETQKGIKEGICPRCGGVLVERTSKADGRKFLGCSNYPKCKFTKKID